MPIVCQLRRRRRTTRRRSRRRRRRSLRDLDVNAGRGEGGGGGGDWEEDHIDAAEFRKGCDCDLDADCWQVRSCGTCHMAHVTCHTLHLHHSARHPNPIPQTILASRQAIKKPPALFCLFSVMRHRQAKACLYASIRGVTRGDLSGTKKWTVASDM